MCVSLSIGEGSTRLCFSSLRVFSSAQRCNWAESGLWLFYFFCRSAAVLIIVLLHDLIKPNFSWWTDGLTFDFRIFLYTEKCQNPWFYRGAHT